MEVLSQGSGETTVCFSTPRLPLGSYTRTGHVIRLCWGSEKVCVGPHISIQLSHHSAMQAPEGKGKLCELYQGVVVLDSWGEGHVVSMPRERWGEGRGAPWALYWSFSICMEVLPCNEKTHIHVHLLEERGKSSLKLRFLLFLWCGRSGPKKIEVDQHSGMSS